MVGERGPTKKRKKEKKKKKWDLGSKSISKQDNRGTMKKVPLQKTPTTLFFSLGGGAEHDKIHSMCIKV